MDKFKTCNICKEEISQGDSVVVISDATCVAEPKGDRGAEYEEDSGWDVTYRGIYCPDCWDDMLGKEDELYKEYHPDQDTYRIASATASPLKAKQ